MSDEDEMEMIELPKATVLSLMNNATTYERMVNQEWPGRSTDAQDAVEELWEYIEDQ